MPDVAGLVILAGGIASRMRRSLEAAEAGEGATVAHLSKGMIGVGGEGRPFLDYILRNAEQAALKDVVLVVNERDASIRNWYGDEGGEVRFPGLRISYATQQIPEGREKPLGTADALLQALTARPDWNGRHLLVCNSDNLYSVPAFRELRAQDGIGGWIDYDVRGLRFSDERVAQFGITRKDADGYLTAIVEKPTLEQLVRERAETGTVRVSMNLWRLSYDLVYPALEQCPLHPVRGEKELPVAIGRMIEAHPRTLLAVPRCEHVPDLTSASDIEEVRRYLREQAGDAR